MIGLIRKIEITILSILTKMKNKIINFFSDLLVSKRKQDSEFRNKQKWININQQCITQKENNQSKYFRINISFIENYVLDIEFFDESHDDIEIRIFNQYVEAVYELSIFTVPTLHIIVEMKEWLPGFYRLIIQDKSQFYLNESFILNKIDLHNQSEKFSLDQNFRDENTTDIYSAYSE